MLILSVRIGYVWLIGTGKCVKPHHLQCPSLRLPWLSGAEIDRKTHPLDSNRFRQILMVCQSILNTYNYFIICLKAICLLGSLVNRTHPDWFSSSAMVWLRLLALATLTSLTRGEQIRDSSLWSAWASRIMQAWSWLWIRKVTPARWCVRPLRGHFWWWVFDDFEDQLRSIWIHLQMVTVQWFGISPF